MSCNRVETAITRSTTNGIFLCKIRSTCRPTFTCENGGTFPVKGAVFRDFRWRDYEFKKKSARTPRREWHRYAKKRKIMILGFLATVGKKNFSTYIIYPPKQWLRKIILLLQLTRSFSNDAPYYQILRFAFIVSNFCSHAITAVISAARR